MDIFHSVDVPGVNLTIPLKIGICVVSSFSKTVNQFINPTAIYVCVPESVLDNYVLYNYECPNGKNNTLF